MFEWAGKPISRSFKLEIKRAVHTLSSFLGTGYSNLPDDAWVRSLLERAHGVGTCAACASRCGRARTRAPRRC